MARALAEARQAEALGEVPIGALVVRGGELLGAAGNSPISHRDPAAHAEILALREAGHRLGNYRLLGTTLYVTLEPCLMCVGAMIHGRIERLVFGAYDPKSGAAGSRLNGFTFPNHNHRVECVGGILADQCGAQLQAFFRRRREPASS